MTTDISNKKTDWKSPAHLCFRVCVCVYVCLCSMCIVWGQGVEEDSFVLRINSILLMQAKGGGVSESGHKALFGLLPSSAFDPPTLEEAKTYLHCVLGQRGVSALVVQLQVLSPGFIDFPLILLYLGAAAAIKHVNPLNPPAPPSLQTLIISMPCSCLAYMQTCWVVFLLWTGFEENVHFWQRNY